VCCNGKVCKNFGVCNVEVHVLVVGNFAPSRDLGFDNQGGIEGFHTNDKEVGEKGVDIAECTAEKIVE
jgi:hypothetical protein